MTEQEVLEFANINGYNLISKIQQEENELSKIINEQSNIHPESIYENIMLEYSKTIVKNIILDYSNSLTEETKLKLEKFINSNNCIEFLDKEKFPQTSKSGKTPSAFAHNEKGTVVFPKYDNSEDIIKFIRKQKQLLIHEIFHIVTKNNLEKEMNSKYNIEYKKGMLFNEALVEKSARDFATKHNFLYHPVISYIPYVRSLETFMQKYNIGDNSQMFNIDFDKIISIATPEQIKKYYELEDIDIRKKLSIEERKTGKIEYLRNFKLKTTSGEKRKIDDHEVLRSYKENVKPKYMEQQKETKTNESKKESEHIQSSIPKKQKPFAQRSQSEIQVHEQIKQKNQAIKQQKAQRQQLNKPKVKTLTQSSSNNGESSSSKGFTNIITLSLIVSFVCGALFMVVYMLLKG